MGLKAKRPNGLENERIHCISSFEIHLHVYHCQMECRLYPPCPPFVQNVIVCKTLKNQILPPRSLKQKSVFKVGGNFLAYLLLSTKYTEQLCRYLISTWNTSGMNIQQRQSYWNMLRRFLFHVQRIASNSYTKSHVSHSIIFPVKQVH